MMRFSMATALMVVVASNAHGYARAWNPSIFPFLPASTDTTRVREIVLRAQGVNKKILDIGCGQGYSTAISQGSVGIDAELRNIRNAKKLFPDKTFKHGILSSIEHNDEYDVVTSMFYFHKIPQFLRKMIIENALNIAKERVVILDVSPDYEAGNEMFKQSTFLPDYYKNCRDDLSEFTETKLMDGVLSIWIYEVN
jgi:hypothetical protein|tara:strand:- start:24 stop:611 length:588 start_codon:yes stop_codon:yes gene_type:complete